MISLGIVLILIALIIFAIIWIWYALNSSNGSTQSISYLVAIAFALLIIGVVFASWSLMSRGIAYNHKGLPGLAGVHSPFASPN